MQTSAKASSTSGWAVVAVLFAATTCVESMSWTQLTAYTPLYLRELHVPASQIPSWIAAISSLGWIIALPLAPFWGVLADRYSRKAVIVRSAVLEAVIFAGWALSTGPLMALVFRSLNGLVLGNTGVMLAVQASTTTAFTRLRSDSGNLSVMSLSSPRRALRKSRRLTTASTAHISAVNA